MNLLDITMLIAAVAVIVSVVLFLKYKRITAASKLVQAESVAIRDRYRPIVDLDAELAKRSEEVKSQIANRDSLTAAYARDYEVYKRLKAEVALLEENLEDMSCGVYKPHYDFGASEEYRTARDEVYRQKKEFVRDGRAAVCETTWTVGGSAKEGARMTKQNMKLLLRAFNGEADAAIAKATWNNATRMEERIRRAYSTINDMGAVVQTRITPEYLNLTLAELRLSYEYDKKKHDEAEAQREERERRKEEERAQRDFERAEQEAATDQSRYERMLAKARAEVEEAKGDELETVNARVRELEEKLAEAQAKMERAKSMAEQTRCGYIYVISNIGSFGERVFKIGMTRRLEPMDRIRELGDASVPFPFDVHAMIYSDDAPALEKELHQQFENKSINLVNMRKEFFEVSLDEIEAFARSKGVTVEFTRLVEAQEYRETCATRAGVQAAALPVEATPKPASPEFPEALPGTPLPGATPDAGSPGAGA